MERRGKFDDRTTEKGKDVKNYKKEDELKLF